MFRIRCIYDVLLPINQHAVAQVESIIREQFTDVADSKIREIPEKLHNPMKYDFRSVLFVCDDRNGNVKGFALFSAEPALKFGFLDLIALSNKTKGGGVGAALYQRIQEECVSLGFDWLFFECLTDLPQYNQDPIKLKENRSRLRFYERLGARPVIDTLYELPRKANAGNAYFLMADDLDQDKPLSQTTAVAAVKAILYRKYKRIMRSKLIQHVVDSIQNDPVHIRGLKYTKQQVTHHYPRISKDKRITLCVSDAHVIHHIQESGYVELPVRVSTILDELEKTDLFDRIPQKHYADSHILKVHDKRFVKYFKEVALSIPPEKALFPDVFPIRKQTNRPKNNASHVGYYCIDIYSPVNRNSYIAARQAVDATLTAANAIERGSHFSYALVRPPGHHAGWDSFGGYCYFNSTAIAANYLSKFGKVAILDLDYHHGNGQQEIFYHRDDVLTISIHGDPSFEYPYFSGYKDEMGEQQGKGFNINFPLKRAINGPEYMKTLLKAKQKIQAYKPNFLVIALGLDTALNDPSGTWNLVSEDYSNNGKLLGRLNVPTLVVQEGGYDCAVLGKNALAFLSGMWSGFYHR